MRAVGLEPTRSFEHGHLKPACLPVSSRPRRGHRTRSRVESVGGAFYVGGIQRRGATMRSAEEFNEVQRLVAAGMNDCAIARLTGIPRTTVRDMRRRPGIRPRNLAGSSDCGIEHDFACACGGTRTATSWAYTSAMAISHATAESGDLRVVLDKKYPAIIDRCRVALDTLMPGQHAGVCMRRGASKSGCTRSTGRACSPNTAPAGSTRGRSDSSPGSKRSSTGPPRSSSSA